ncbi:hypothetical protein BJ912DRAFT_925938 [Pholiota molesta]|nr:hypothetical protein BJ912DRAFT_925938 [Pholiota molesta]
MSDLHTPPVLAELELQYPVDAPAEEFHVIEVRDPRVLTTLQHAVTAAFADEKNALRHVVRKIESRSDRLEKLKEDFETQLEKTILTKEVARLVGVYTGTSYRTLSKVASALSAFEPQYEPVEVNALFERSLELCTVQELVDILRYEYYNVPVPSANPATSRMQEELRKATVRMNSVLERFENLAGHDGFVVGARGEAREDPIDVDLFGEYESSHEESG